ncbi:unnamed protein product [Somion occarium]|uniref:Uncharacterized protein n=2 Tax=Somion occarium TaxID=3059160 RepID=A0ABP1E5X0_9APHY
MSPMSSHRTTPMPSRRTHSTEIPFVGPPYTQRDNGRTRIDALEEELAELQEENENLRTHVIQLQKSQSNGNEKKRTSDSQCIISCHPCTWLVHISDSPATVIMNAQAHMVALKDEDRVASIEEMKEMDEDSRDEKIEEELSEWRAQERNLIAYGQLLRLLPNLERHLSESTPESVEDFTVRLRRGASEARSDDINRCTSKLGSLLNHVQDPRERPDPLLNVDGNNMRANRGLSHKTCCRWLLPIDVALTEETLSKAASLEIDLSDNWFIRLFYKDGEGDPSNVEENFLMSTILLYQAVFTSPSSATGSIDGDSDDEDAARRKRRRGSRAVRSSVADKLHMNNQVTPRSIAYICVLAHFSLTDATQWDTTVYDVDYTAMYEFIVDYLEDTPTEQSRKNAETILSWWNRKVFKGKSSGIHGNQNKSRKRLAAQRRERSNVVSTSADS